MAALSFSIAANTTLYAALDALLFPRSGIANANQLMVAFVHYRPDEPRLALAQHLQERGTAYQGVTGLSKKSRVLVANGANYREVTVAFVLPNFFSVLGNKPSSGRLFGPSDSLPSSEVAVISRGLEKALFGPSGMAAGAAILMGGRSLGIVGVIDKAFPSDVQAWILRRMDYTPALTLVRLKDGVPAEQARKELRSIQTWAAAEAGAGPARITMQPAIDKPFRILSFHTALLLSVFAVLVIAALNIATLQFSRGLSQSRELATRIALGAGRSTLVKHTLLEGFVLFLPSVAIGLLLSFWSYGVLQSQMPSNLFAEGVEPQWSWRVLATSVTISLSVAIGAAVIPATLLSSLDAGKILRGEMTAPVWRAGSYSGGLVVVQVGLALAVTVACTLLTRSSVRLSSNRLRGDTRPLVEAVVRQSTAGIPRNALATRLVDRLKQRPEVIDASVIVLSGQPNGSAITLASGNREVLLPQEFNFHLVTTGYFRTLGIRMAKGRDFHPNGERLPVAIVNATAARNWWPAVNPVGQRVKLGGVHSRALEVEIIGVAVDAALDPSRDVVEPALVLSHMDDSTGSRSEAQVFEVVLRSRKPAQTVLEMRLAGGAAQSIWAETWDRSRGIEQLRLRHSFFASLFALLSLFALMLAALGCYSVVQQRVSQRLREYGIRYALGATRRELIVLVLRETQLLALIGIALGLLIAKWSAGLLRAYMLGLETMEPYLFATAGALTLAVVLGASIPAALRIRRLDPASSIRST